MSITEKNGLKINTKLFDFVNNEIIPGTNIKSEEFWNNFGNIVHELAPINKKLIQKREDIQKKIDDWHKKNKGKDLEFLAGKIQQAQEETAQKVFAENGAAMQKIIGELIQAKQIKVLLQKNETILFSDPAMDLTDDVTSMLDVAASEASTQSE